MPEPKYGEKLNFSLGSFPEVVEKQNMFFNKIYKGDKTCEHNGQLRIISFKGGGAAAAYFPNGFVFERKVYK